MVKKNILNTSQLQFTYIGTGRRKSEFITGDYYSKTEVEL